MLETMIALLPHDALEPECDIYERAQESKKVLKKFLEENPLQGDEKIAVVCHSKLIAATTADGFEGEGALSKLTNFVWTKNAEVLPIDF